MAFFKYIDYKQELEYIGTNVNKTVRNLFNCFCLKKKKKLCAGMTVRWYRPHCYS